MKKGVLLNSEISYAISKLGHGDSIVIGDSGLPIPSSCLRIDLAVSNGIPSFVDVLDAVLTEQRIEEVVIARETREVNPSIYQSILDRITKIEKADNYKIKLTEVNNHDEFKQLSKDSKAVIRTGECTPFANILLISGVVF